MTNLLIAYPDIPARGTLTSNAAAANPANVAYGSLTPGLGYTTKTADDVVIEFHPGTSDPYDHIAVLDAKSLADGGVSTLVVQTGSRALAPSGMTGIQAWYDAGRGVVKDSSGLVSEWRDISGNNRHLTASGADRPTWAAHNSTYNRNAGIAFSGSNIMRADAVASLFTGSDTPIKVFYALKSDATAGTRCIVGLGRESVSTPIMAFQSSVGGNRDVVRGDDGGVGVTTTFGSATTDYEVHSIDFNGTQTTFHVNLTNLGTSAQNVGTLTLDRFAVGGLRRGGANERRFQGVISEVIVAGGTLSGADFDEVRLYMNGRHITPPVYSTTALSSVSLVGTRAQNFLSTLSGTGGTRWWIRLGTNKQSAFRCSKIMIGKALDLGRDPIWGRSAEVLVAGPHARARRYKYQFVWEGLTTERTQTFISTIAEKADSTVFMLYTNEGYDPTLLNDKCVAVVLTEYETEVLAHNTWRLSATFEEAG